ncbi:hypothetical protein WMF38_17315 [Sorangium sp. So ce118]
MKKILTEELGAALGQRPELKLVTVADGANDNWDFLHGALPPSVEVIDFYHAAEHLNVALSAAYGEGTVKCRAQFDKLRLVLLEDPTVSRKSFGRLSISQSSTQAAAALGPSWLTFASTAVACGMQPGGPRAFPSAQV